MPVVLDIEGDDGVKLKQRLVWSLREVTFGFWIPGSGFRIPGSGCWASGQIPPTARQGLLGVATIVPGRSRFQGL